VVPHLAIPLRSPIELAPALPAAILPPRQTEAAALLNAASKAARARHARNCVRRVAYVLFELAAASAPPATGLVVLSRTALAEALGISLSKVKRTLALLSLSQVIACDERGIRVRDWRRLAETAGCEVATIEDADEADESDRLPVIDQAPLLLTTSGDPAYFG
jgi:hypothetical protein